MLWWFPPNVQHVVTRFHLERYMQFYLLARLPQPGDSEMTFHGLRVKLSFVICWTSQRYRHPVKCLAQGHNKRTCLLIANDPTFTTTVRRSCGKIMKGDAI